MRRSQTQDLPLSIVVLGFALLYVPFVAKPIHMDDPMYLWAAEHILHRPFDFYGFDVNWADTLQPMSSIMQNPPLTSFLIAAVAVFTGWSEVALHLAFFLPAAGVLAGTYALARELDASPGVAAVITALSPAFLVSSTTLMADVPMLCGWVWCILLWMRGLRRGSNGLLALAAAVAALTALTKYSGVCLIPLLAVYSLAAKRRPDSSLVWLMIPVAVMAVYQLVTGSLYGQGLLLGAAAYTERARGTISGPGARTVIATAFVGACSLPVFVQLPRQGWWKIVLAGIAVATASAVALAIAGHVGQHELAADGRLRWALILQIAASFALGAGVLAFGIYEGARRRDAEGVLLVAWILGTFAFSAWVNWTVNVRSLLPLVPAVALVAARRPAVQGSARSWRTMLLLAPAALLAIAVTWADLQLAVAGRRAAHALAVEHSAPGRTVWFEGHWGFQYYAEREGLIPLAAGRSHLLKGDVVIVPRNNSNVVPLQISAFTLARTESWPVPTLLATMSYDVGAGFYTSDWGALPFALGEVLPERYYVLSITTPFTFAGEASSTSRR